MFPVTVTLQNAAQLTAVMAALGANAAVIDESTKVAATKQAKPQPDPNKAEAKVEKTTGTVSSISEEKADPKPAAAATAPAPAAAQTASSDVAMTEADLTKVVVAAVARVGKEDVLKVLQDKFNVTAGKQITDPAVRAQAKEALEAL